MKEKEQLRIIKKLPQIILPAQKNEMFLKWYDEDLRFQDEIPKTFERGYVFLENNFFSSNLLEYKRFRIHLTKMAKIMETTYRNVENVFYTFLDETKNTTIYFEFENNFLYLKVYVKEKLFNKLTLDMSAVDKSKPNDSVLETLELMIETGAEFSDMYAYYCYVLTQCCLWYLATTTNTTKYKREGKPEPFYYERKEVINPKRNKTITTPIYDMKKIRTVKIDSLIKRRKGWTYSHSFQVHGHYRHYKDGKVIFIEPFIKGKGKEEMSQVITLNPKG